jgi:hypothetical protein
MSDARVTELDDGVLTDEVEPLPEDDLEHYDGRWVAMRDGKVVAHEADEEALRANPAVRPTDDVFPVGQPPSGFYTVCA